MDVIDEIPDQSLDLCYVDGDHTLRGITIDLVRAFQKVRLGGWIGGDDFSSTIWQHSTAYEPTLVFPFAVHFAEAVGAEIYALPHSQFLMHCTSAGFSFSDLTTEYGDVTPGKQLATSTLLKKRLRDFTSYFRRRSR